LPENLKAAANHATDFDPPLYNVWKQQEKSAGLPHPGRDCSSSGFDAADGCQGFTTQRKLAFGCKSRWRGSPPRQQRRSAEFYALNFSVDSQSFSVAVRV
jgi:hypothetical protein